MKSVPVWKKLWENIPLLKHKQAHCSSHTVLKYSTRIAWQEREEVQLQPMLPNKLQSQQVELQLKWKRSIWTRIKLQRLLRPHWLKLQTKRLDKKLLALGKPRVHRKFQHRLRSRSSLMCHPLMQILRWSQKTFPILLRRRRATTHLLQRRRQRITWVKTWKIWTLMINLSPEVATGKEGLFRRVAMENLI